MQEDCAYHAGRTIFRVCFLFVPQEGFPYLNRRLFGPLYPISYVLWIVLGTVVGTLVWLVRRGSWWKTVDTIAYYDNPFETWAYRRDERWPHPGADAKLAWGGSRYTKSKE